MTTRPGGQGRHELARRGRCPECNEEYERLAGHWKGPCGPPALDRRQRALVAGLLLGNGHVGGNGPTPHFQVSTRWRPLAEWVFRELDWLGDPVPGVAYKWAAEREAYQDAKRDAEALRARLWYEGEHERAVAGVDPPGKPRE